MVEKPSFAFASDRAPLTTTEDLHAEFDAIVSGAAPDKPPSCPTTVEFLNMLREQLTLRSDYALAKYLNVTQKTVKTWRAGRGGFSDSMAMRIEDELKFPRGYVVACMHAERERSDSSAQRMWERMAELARRNAAAVLAVLLLGGFAGAPKAYAGAGAAVDTDGLYIMRSGRRRKRPKNRPLALPPPASVSAALRGWNRPHAA